VITCGTMKSLERDQYGKKGCNGLGQTVLRGLPCIRRRLSRGDRALRDAAHSIHLIRIQLSHTMKMQTRAIILDLVVDGNLKGISPVTLDSGARDLPIDSLYHPRYAVRAECDVLNVESVGAHDAGVGVVGVVVGLEVVVAPLGAGCGVVAGADVAWHCLA